MIHNKRFAIFVLHVTSTIFSCNLNHSVGHEQLDRDRASPLASPQAPTPKKGPAPRRMSNGGSEQDGAKGFGQEPVGQPLV